MLWGDWLISIFIYMVLYAFMFVNKVTIDRTLNVQYSFMCRLYHNNFNVVASTTGRSLQRIIWNTYNFYICILSISLFSYSFYGFELNLEGRQTAWLNL